MHEGPIAKTIRARPQVTEGQRDISQTIPQCRVGFSSSTVLSRQEEMQMSVNSNRYANINQDFVLMSRDRRFNAYPLTPSRLGCMLDVVPTCACPWIELESSCNIPHSFRQYSTYALYVSSRSAFCRVRVEIWICNKL